MTDIEREELRTAALAAKGDIDCIYLHQTAGRYGQYFADYHISIDGDGSVPRIADDFTERRNHTWHRNTGAIGIALCCAYEAEANHGYDVNWGDYPPTAEQIEAAAEAVAILANVLGIEITPETVMTHCEAAAIDGYGPGSGDPETRWDLWYLKDSDGEIKLGGEVIRGKAIWYQQHMQ